MNRMAYPLSPDVWDPAAQDSGSTLHTVWTDLPNREGQNPIPWLSSRTLLILLTAKLAGNFEICTMKYLIYIFLKTLKRNFLLSREIKKSLVCVGLFKAFDCIVGIIGPCILVQ
jgi:hypothetical protein